jgi:hypothetical protein
MRIRIFCGAIKKQSKCRARGSGCVRAENMIAGRDAHLQKKRLIHLITPIACACRACSLSKNLHRQKTTLFKISQQLPRADLKVNFVNTRFTPPALTIHFRRACGGKENINSLYQEFDSMIRT